MVRLIRLLWWVIKFGCLRFCLVNKTLSYIFIYSGKVRLIFKKLQNRQNYRKTDQPHIFVEFTPVLHLKRCNKTCLSQLKGFIPHTCHSSLVSLSIMLIFLKSGISEFYIYWDSSIYIVVSYRKTKLKHTT